jgi:hypothetical protein
MTLLIFLACGISFQIFAQDYLFEFGKNRAWKPWCRENLVKKLPV